MAGAQSFSAGVSSSYFIILDVCSIIWSSKEKQQQQHPMIMKEIQTKFKRPSKGDKDTASA